MAVILIVDDRPICREFLITLLKYQNHVLLEADDGMQAYKMITESRPALIITDLLMPTMNGYELVQKIKAEPQFAGIPIIFYTASFLLDEAKLLAETCDVKYVLFKPSDPQLILHTVNLALGNQATAPVESSKSESIMHMSSTSDTLLKYITELEKAKNNFNPVIKVIHNLGSEGEKLSNQALEFSQSFSQLSKMSCQLLAMTELNQNLISERESKHLLKLFCDGANQIIGSKYCFLGFIAQKNNLNYIKQYEWSGVYDDNKLKSYASLAENSLIKQTLQADHAVLVNEISNNVQAEFVSELAHITRFLGVRLITHSHLYGFIYFADKLDGSKFDDLDAQVANMLAAQISMLYENIHLYEVIQRHAANLQLSISKKKIKKGEPWKQEL